MGGGMTLDSPYMSDERDVGQRSSMLGYGILMSSVTAQQLLV